MASMLAPATKAGTATIAKAVDSGRPGDSRTPPSIEPSTEPRRADAIGPAHARGPAGRRIVGGGQGVDSDLAARGAEPGTEHGERHQPGHRGHIADSDDEHARQRVGKAEHAVRIEPVHDPAERHAA
jgi:hypothetical protein